MRHWLTLSTFLALLMPVVLPAERIICLGDSLTAGYLMDPTLAYPSILESLLRESGKDVTVVNAGVSGETSAGGLRRLSWVLKDNVDCLIIALGANDALRGQPVEQTRENLRQIIQQAHTRHPEMTIILTGMRAPPNMGREFADAFAAIYIQLSEEEEVLFYPFLLQDVAARPEFNLDDGIHPSIEGHRRIAVGLRDLILQP